MKIKFTALNHYIEKEKNKKINDPPYIINTEDIINNFDNLYNDISYQFPSHIKNKVIKKFCHTRVLPNSLAVENPIDDINVNCDITIPETNSSS